MKRRYLELETILGTQVYFADVRTTPGSGGTNENTKG